MSPPRERTHSHVQGAGPPRPLHVLPELAGHGPAHSDDPGAAGGHRRLGRRVCQTGLQAPTTVSLPEDSAVAVFIIREDGSIMPHYYPERMELDASALTDSAGCLYGPELVGATEEGDWVH